jgi:hypothetical protein
MSRGVRRTTAETTSTAAKETTETPGTPKTACKPELVKTLDRLNVFFCIFFGGLGCVHHSFAHVTRFVFLRDVWIRTQRGAVASRCATNIDTHLPDLATYIPDLANHLPDFNSVIATHLPNLATNLPKSSEKSGYYLELFFMCCPNLNEHSVGRIKLFVIFVKIRISAYGISLKIVSWQIFVRDIV